MNQGSISLDESLVQLYAQIDDIDSFCKVMPNLIMSHFNLRGALIGFKPNTFRLDVFAFPEAVVPHAMRYLSEGKQYDIWMERSPIHPGVTAVRHSDYTPLALLKKSKFFKNLLEPSDSLFGASIVAWSGRQWLAMLTMLKSKAQGDFTEKEMELLERIQPHFSKIISRLAAENEKKLRQSSLSAFVRYLPSSFILMRLDGSFIEYNYEARKICHLLRYGPSARQKKLDRIPILPSDLVPLIDQLRASIRSQSKNTKATESLRHVIESKLKVGLQYRVTYIKEKIVRGMHEGLFLIVFEEYSVRQKTELNVLTDREKVVARLAAEGNTNEEIALKLGKGLSTIKHQMASVFNKLAIRQRHQLIRIME